MKLGYVVDGPPAAPALLLSPSLGTTTSLWDTIVPSLAQRWRVVRHDHPGHGRSPVPVEPVAVEGIGRALLALLDDLGIDRCAFCGISLGGMVGLWLGIHAPERLDTLALCCTGAKLGTREDYAARAERVRREGTPVVVEGARERWFTEGFRDAPEARRILAQLAAVDPRGYAACAEAVGAWDARDDLGRVGVAPTLVFGAEDPVTPPEVRAALAEGIPGARSVVLPGAAHLANVEQPDAFTAAIEGGR